MPTANSIYCQLSTESLFSSTREENNQPFIAEDFNKWVKIGKDLVEQGATWDVADLRLLEQCLLHWSLQTPSLNVLTKDRRQATDDEKMTLMKLWRRMQETPIQLISRCTFDYALHALSRWGLPALAEECFQVFLQYTDTFARPKYNVPSPFHTKAVCRAYENLQQPEEAEAFLRKCLENPRTAKIVDSKTVQQALIAWKNAANGERAEALLKWVEQGQHEHIDLTIYNYNTVCLAWGRNYDRNDAGMRAEKFMKEMPIKPDSFCWKGVLHAWTLINAQPEGLYHAEELLWHAVQTRADLSSLCFNEILHAYARLGMADRAIQFLQRWVHDATHIPLPDSLAPNLESFNSVINALAKTESPNAGDRAYALLKVMREKFHLTPDAITYNSLLSAYAQSGNTEAIAALLNHLEKTNWRGIPLGDDKAQRTYAYDSLIRAWSVWSGRVPESERFSCAIHAASVLDHMVKLGINPHGSSYSFLFRTFAQCNSEKAAMAAEDLIDWIEKRGTPLESDHGVRVLNAWARVGNPQRAIALLKRLEASHKRRNEKLITAHYNCVLQAYSLISDEQKMAFPNFAEEADAILTQLMSSEEFPGPDAISFMLTLDCWKRSQHVDMASRAWAVLQQFLENFDQLRKVTRQSDPEKLILDSHISVLFTCAGVPVDAGVERRELALSIALQAYSQMPRRDHQTYYAALQAFHNLMQEKPGDEREALIRNTFLEYAQQSARQNGGMDGRLFRLLQRLVPSETYSAIRMEARIICGLENGGWADEARENNVEA